MFQQHPNKMLKAKVDKKGIDGRTDGRMGGWIDRRKESQTDRQIHGLLS